MEYFSSCVLCTDLAIFQISWKILVAHSSAKFAPHSFKSNGRLTKSKGFRHVYAKDTKPIYDDDAYLVSTDDDKKKKYELNDKA